MKVNFKRYFLYLVRWQLSTPSLAIVLIWLSTWNQWAATAVANLIGGLIFFWVDQFIFTSQKLTSQWEVKENIICADCGETKRGYRLVKTKNYDRSNDKNPQFRCEKCSQIKSDKLKQTGVEI
jgi:hypothetical protein